MISNSTIEEVKASAKVVEVISDYIKLNRDHGACCPFHDEKTPSFKVDVKENFYKCFGCGKAGDAVQFLMDYKKIDYPSAIKILADKYKIAVTEDKDNSKKVYARPVWKNNTQLDDNTVKWFEKERKISQKTLLKMQVTTDKVWMPEVKFKTKTGDVKTLPQGDRNVICFNYFRGEEFINVKYRDAVKGMRMHKDAELIFYNLNSLKGAKKIYITEGEIDALSLVEIGLDLIPHTSILSVPNGANIKSNNLAYLDSSIDLFDPDAEIIICSDDDNAGRKLRDDLAERLGRDRCKYIECGEELNDVNKVLQVRGPEGLMSVLANKKEFPIVGTFKVSDYSNAIDDMYTNGIERGVGIGLEKMDSLIRYVTGWITTITGMPSSGKSDILDQIILGLMLNHGWKAAFYSPENDPFQLHFSKLARKLIGKSWYGQNKINEQEKNLVKNFLEDKLFIIKPKADFTLDTILESVKRLKQQRGVNCFCIDAWNRLEHKYSGANEAKYVQESLTKLDAFCRHWNIHCFLVAHPTKMEPDKRTGEYPVPRLYNISGGAHFRNITANGLSVHRDFKKGITQVFVQKVKFIPYWGDIGFVDLKYNLESGRFTECNGDGSVFVHDYSNWITKENRQNKIDLYSAPVINEEPHGIILSNDYSDPPF